MKKIWILVSALLLVWGLSPGVLFADRMDTQAELGDLDNDGSVDVVLCVRNVPYNPGNPQSNIKIFMNLHAGTDIEAGFTDRTATQLPKSWWVDSIKLEDIDGDNDLDIIGIKGDGLSCYFNDGTGKFALAGRMYELLTVQFSSTGFVAPGVLFADRMDTQAELGDLDNDGSVDVVLCARNVPYKDYIPGDAQGNIKIFMNLHAGTDIEAGFTDRTATQLPKSWWVDSIKLEDIDGDNDLDIIGIKGDGLSCYFNDGTGKFALTGMIYADIPDEPPIAQASATPNVGVSPLTVQFSSAGSVDPEGGALTYQWDFGDGEGSDEANPAHTFAAGSSVVWNYTVMLSVTDDAGAVDNAVVLVVVRKPVPDDLAPIARAGAVPKRGTAPLQVHFSSIGSIDPDGGEMSYAWDFGDGATSEEGNPVHTYTAAGSYNVRLIVTDNEGSKKEDSVRINVNTSNQSPRARASATPNVGPAPLTVQLSSAGSVDPEGGTLTYHWDFGDGASSDEANPTHVYEYKSEYDSRKDGLFVFGGSVNRYTAVLTVTDVEGKTGNSKVMVIVRNPVVISKKPPIAKASANPASGSSPLTVQFSNSGSVDPDGGALTYQWDFGDGTNSNEANPAHTYICEYIIPPPQEGLEVVPPAPRNYKTVLTVTDDEGEKCSAEVVVVVYPKVISKKPPIAKALANPASGVSPLTVQFSSAGSVDPEGGALTYQWDFGDGASSDEANPTYVYEYKSEYDSRKDGLFVFDGSVNRYVAVLTVTDVEGKTGSAKVMVLVRKPVEIPNRPLNILREWRGETSSVLPHWGKNLVIKTEDEWKPLWVRRFDGNGEKIYDGPPAVDFETEMVLYVSAVAPYPGSRSIKITNIIQTATEIVVSVQIKRPLKKDTSVAAVLSYPFHAVAIKKSSLPVRFVVTGEQDIQ